MILVSSILKTNANFEEHKQLGHDLGDHEPDAFYQRTEIR